MLCMCVIFDDLQFLLRQILLLYAFDFYYTLLWRSDSIIQLDFLFNFHLGFSFYGICVEI